VSEHLEAERFAQVHGKSEFYSAEFVPPGQARRSAALAGATSYFFSRWTEVDRFHSLPEAGVWIARTIRRPLELGTPGAYEFHVSLNKANVGHTRGIYVGPRGHLGLTRKTIPTLTTISSSSASRSNTRCSIHPAVNNTRGKEVQ